MSFTNSFTRKNVSFEAVIRVAKEIADKTLLLQARHLPITHPEEMFVIVQVLLLMNVPGNVPVCM